MSKGSLKKLSLFSLIMVSSAFVTSVRNLPTIAETGLQMLAFGVIAAIGYFIPIGLVSAELATGWPKKGGVYVWAKEAFGPKIGFVTIWLQWIYMSFSVVAMLYFIGGSMAFVFNPDLADSRTFLIIMNLLVIWVFTMLNLRGMETSAKISSVGFLSGVVFPAALIMILGIVYLLMGNPASLNLSFTAKNLIPDFRHIGTLVLLIGFMRAFAGIEASAVHANEVDNPQRNYPLAILAVVLIGLGVNIFGSLSVAVVVPQKDISLISGIMDAFTVFFSKFHLKWLVPVLGFLVACGQIGGVSTWFTGPIKGLGVAADDGDLPPFCRKENKHGMPYRLFIIQAIWISIVSTAFLLLPTLNMAFWVSVALSMMIYVSMYFLLLLSGLVLRYKSPETPRAYKVFGKNNVGMWITAMIGMATMVFAFIIAIFPPSELPSHNTTRYILLLAFSIIAVFIFPWIVLLFKKYTWGKQLVEDEEENK